MAEVYSYGFSIYLHFHMLNYLKTPCDENDIFFSCDSVVCNMLKDKQYANSSANNTIVQHFLFKTAVHQRQSQNCPFPAITNM